MQETREQINASGLRGDLSQVGLSSLLVLIEMERKTGLLQLRGPEGTNAQILVRDGKVVHARLDGLDEPVDADCVYYLLDVVGRRVRVRDVRRRRRGSRQRVDHAPA